VPIAYLVALIVLYIRLPHPFGGRMLLPIVPVACLMTGLLLHHAGLDDIPWRRTVAPGFAVPVTLATAVVFLVLVPYRLGALEIAGLLPMALLRRFGWEADHFAVGVLLPVVVLVAWTALTLVAGSRRARVAALLVAFLVFFGVRFELGRASLVEHRAAQQSELLLYPWRTFRDALQSAPSRTVALSRDLKSHFDMSAPTQSSLGRLALGRSDLRVITVGRFPANVELAIASRYSYDAWRREVPGLAPALADTATFDPAGFLVLVRPREAAERAASGAAPLPDAPSELAPRSLDERLESLKLLTEPEAHAEVLREILDRLRGPDRGRSLGLQHVEGDRLRAVGLSPDGWTDGVRAAAVIATNPGDHPAIQELRLAVNADSSQLPIDVFVDDGERVTTVRFERRGLRTVELGSLPPGVSRLFVVWSGKEWSPAGDDARRLGVRILGPATTARGPGTS
jgi:hypothetical protein